jgi:hypothetical protein
MSDFRSNKSQENYITDPKLYKKERKKHNVKNRQENKKRYKHKKK